MSEDLSCARCIHMKMCNARQAVDGVITAWNEQYPYASMQTNPDDLAEHCTEYQTLSDIHVIKQVEEPTPKRSGIFGLGKKRA
jgi:hypothetical protein